MKDELGRRLESVLELKGWTQEGLAQRSGVPQSTISKVLAGKRSTRFEIIARLAYALDVSLDWLATGEARQPEEMTPEEQVLLENYRRIGNSVVKEFVFKAAKEAPKREE